LVTVAVGLTRRRTFIAGRMSLESERLRLQASLLVFDWIERGRSRAEAKWESRSDFQGRWKGWKTCFWFSRLSTGRHFPQPLPACGLIGIRMLASRRAEHRAIFPVRGRLQSDTSDEEALRCETGAVLSVYLLLHEDSRIRSLRIRHAELFQRYRRHRCTRWSSHWRPMVSSSGSRGAVGRFEC